MPLGNLLEMCEHCITLMNCVILKAQPITLSNPSSIEDGEAF